LKSIKFFVFRVMTYCIGLLVLAFGVALAINSDLGVSPVNSLPYVISLVAGAPLSLCVIATFSFYILLQILILKKDFKWYNIFQIVFSTMFGIFVDFAKWVVGDFAIPTYFGKLTMLAVSIVFIAVGITLYLEAKLIPMPIEGLTLALADKSKKIKFQNMKTIVDCLIVVISIAISFVCLGTLKGVREGTILTAVLVGKVIALVQRWLKPLINKFCFPQAEAAKL
jgi:uncharacterized membrane protein YczE